MSSSALQRISSGLAAPRITNIEQGTPNIEVITFSKIENRKSKIENRKSKIENRNRKSKIENRLPHIIAQETGIGNQEGNEEIAEEGDERPGVGFDDCT